MTSSALMGESALAAQLCCSDMLPCTLKQAHELNVVQSTQGCCTQAVGTFFMSCVMHMQNDGPLSLIC